MPLLVAVLGPTASGKTSFAEAAAKVLGAQLINADAFQAYRGMDIGTAKPVCKDRYELLDIKQPDENYGAGEFVLRSQEILGRLFSQGRHAVVVGGTGLYVRALFEEYQQMVGPPDPSLRERLNRRLATDGLAPLVEELRERDPAAATNIDLNNPARVTRALERALFSDTPRAPKLPEFEKMKLALDVPKLTIEDRIVRRVEAMVQNGWVQEVRQLREQGFSLSDPGLRAIGYAQMWQHLDGLLGLDDAISATVGATTRYAKRQRTWLRSEPNLSVLEIVDESPLRVAQELFRPYLQ